MGSTRHSPFTSIQNTMEQLILHLIGDYLLQSDWMANNKTKAFFPAWVHAMVYSLPFLLIGSFSAFCVIHGTHFLIDRFGLAKYVVFAKNFLAPKASWLLWEDCKGTGYPRWRPEYLCVWLLIIADNTLHLAINYLSLKYL